MRGANERARKRVHAAFVMAIGVGLQFLHGFADFEGSGAGRHGLAEADRDGIGNLARNFPEEAAAFEAEDAAPDAVEIHGNDRRVHAFHDAFEAAAEGEQLADAGDLSFGEDADNFTVA